MAIGLSLRISVSTLVIAIALSAASRPVFADGGAGGVNGQGNSEPGGSGYTGNAGGTNSYSAHGGGGGGGGAGGGAGGSGDLGNTDHGWGGAGGTAGSPNGQDGTAAGPNYAGGGGGGGGWNGNGGGAASITNTGTLAGGNGGNGGAGSYAGGGGGAGGYGAIVYGSRGSTNSGSIAGGNGGAGGNGNYGGGGGGGDGGVGVQVSSWGERLTNSGSITGGNGGAGGSGASWAGDGANGAGGAGIAGAYLTIVNSGSISGGLSGDGVTRADAIAFTGGQNTLTLAPGSSLTGNISVNGGGYLLLDQRSYGSVTIDNVITGSSFLDIEAGAGNTITFTGANTYNGGSVLSGTLLMSGAGTLGATTGVTSVHSGATIDLGGTAQTQSGVGLEGGTLKNGSLNGAVTSWGGSISDLGGSASLTTSKKSTGPTKLFGTNTYTGATNINGGTLLGGAANAFSAASVTTVNTGGTLDLGGFAQTIDTVYLAGGTLTDGSLTGAVTSSGGAISDVVGSASLTTTAGTTTLTGTNSFTGGTKVEGGTLAIENGGTLSDLDGLIGNGAGSNGFVTVTGTGTNWTNSGNLYVGLLGTGTLNIQDGGAVSDVFGIIGFDSSSNGTVTVDGPGSTWTNSDRLFVGDNGMGTLTITNGGAVSDVFGFIGFDSSSNGTVTVDGAGSTWSNSGDLFVGDHGTGTLTIKNGGEVDASSVELAGLAGATGTLNIGAGVGDAAAAPGILNATELTFGPGSGTLVFNHTGTNYDFGTPLSGDGTVRQLAGFTILTGDSSGFVGSTSVESGTLAINGVLGGTVDVLSTGRLQGSGTAGDITVSGTLAPGNSIGTLNAASATFNAGSVYAVEVNSAGASDLLNVSGITTINGGKVVVLPYPDFSVNTRYTIVTSAGGVSGTFDAVDFALASMFLTASLSYDVNDVYLAINQQSFASLALTHNQTAAATAAQGLGASNAIYDAIYGLTTVDAARQAYDALSGEVQASVAGVLIEDSRYVRDAVFARLLRASYAGGGASQIALASNGPATSSRMALGATDKGAPSGPAATGLAFWTQGYGAWGSIDGNGNAASVNRTLGGFVSGVDAGLGGGWRAGIATGYARSDLSVDARLSTGDIDSYHLIGYVGGRLGAFALRGGGAWTWSNVETRRAVAFPGFYDRVKASYDGNTGQVFGEVALPLSDGATAWEPFARLAYVHVDTGGFTESGGAAALSSSGTDESLGLSTLGVRVAATAHIAGTEVVPHASLAWQHALGDVDPAATLAFASGGSAFTVLGAPLARDSALLDAGVAVKVAPETTLGLTYSGQLASDVTDNAVTGRFDWRF